MMIGRDELELRIAIWLRTAQARTRWRIGRHQRCRSEASRAAKLRERTRLGAICHRGRTMDKNAYMQFDCSLWIGRHLGMAVTNAETGTNVSEIAERIYRINTPVSMTEDQQFSFNQ